MEKKKKEKNIKKKKKTLTSRLVVSKKLGGIMLFIFLLFLALIFRIGWLQFVNGSSLKEQAYNQQTINRIISTKRGSIYDSTGKKLAISTPVDTVTINPTKIVDKSNDMDKTQQKKELVAKALSDIFELNYEEVLTKVTSTSSVETIIKKVENDKIDKLKQWMSDNKISIGINIDEDTKRAYPYNNLASNLIGFCGNDNNGLEGLELKWDNVLTGIPGKIITSKDAIQEEIPDQNQTYIPAENGSDIVLTIDANIQSIVEKYLKQAVQENKATRGGTAIVMKPSNGDILAMATYPDYDLNTPFEPNTHQLQEVWESLDSKTKTSSLNEMWRNRVIADTYDPGSTFKLITTAVALEENIDSEDIPGEYYCQGYEDVNGTIIKCWRTEPHGMQSLRQSLQNSCNPAFMQLGKKIGTSNLYKYYSAFGLFNKTNISLPGEATGIFHKEQNVGSVELATMSFGQRITVTPLQLVSSVCAIVNDGTLMQPRLVKQIVNPDTGATTNIDPIQIRQVISKSTSERMKDLMESVVTDGTGRLASVSGYSVGGKTGTSEPPVGKESEGYIASYVAVSPAENPEICILIALYNPKGKSYQGGQVCGPVVSQMLSEILPYLGLTSANIQTSTSETNSDASLNITLPDIRNKTVTEAEKILQNAGFKTTSSIKGNKNDLIVTDQTPKPGTSLIKDSIVAIYTSENNIRVSVQVPNLKDLTRAQAISLLKSKNLNISIEGFGKVVSQEIAANTTVEEGTVIKVVLKEELKDAQ